MSAITSAFADIGLPELREKMVFLASDGASVNSGVKTGLVIKFPESGQEWLLFVWCLSHRLELVSTKNVQRNSENLESCIKSLPKFMFLKMVVSSRQNAVGRDG